MDLASKFLFLLRFLRNTGAKSVSVWSVLKIHGKKDNRLNLIDLIDTKHDNTLSKS